MPLKRDEKGGGSNADGSRSTIYCSHCYENGEFLQPNVTVEQMQKLVNEKLAEFRIPKFLRACYPRIRNWSAGDGASRKLISCSVRCLSGKRRSRYDRRFGALRHLQPAISYVRAVAPTRFLLQILYFS
jgi:hypothetical protein